MRQAAILTDLTRCVGCEACVFACKEAHGLPAEGTDRLSAITWTRVERRDGVNIRRHCMHCVEPACASACPVGALSKAPEGPVVYDESKCLGCRYCMLACPFSIPKYEWSSRVPRVRKCIMCYETAVAHGREPACTAACPTGATTFGDRASLIREAMGRIEADPKRYVDHVYGVTEAGGTSVMYLSPVPFEQLGFPTAVRGEPYPRLTWNALSRLPSVVSVAGVGLLGLWWIIDRRNKLAEERHHERREGDEIRPPEAERERTGGEDDAK